MGLVCAGTKRGILVSSFIAIIACGAVVCLPGSASATIIYSDTFDRAALNGGSYTYTTTVTAGDGGASLVSNQLRLTNDATVATNGKGIVYVTTPVSAFDPAFQSVLKDNAHPLTWTMNFRQSAAAPAGMAAGQFGVACILAASSTSVAASGSGYALLIGNGGTFDNVRLIHYAGGLANVGSGASDSSVYVVSGWSVQPTHYYSAQVTYDPANDNWTLYTRDDGTSAFADPADTAGYVNNGSAADTTATSLPIVCAGAYWAYTNTSAEIALFDNFSLEIADGASTPEPASAALLGLISGAMLLGRRRPSPRSEG